MGTIGLYEGYNTTGTPIQTVSVNIPFTGGGRIPIGLTVLDSGEYSIGLNFADLYRNNTGANYPYSIPGLISLEGSPATAGSSFYYYFYDIEVGEKNCLSDSVAVHAIVSDTADFSYTNTNFMYSFTNQSPS